MVLPQHSRAREGMYIIGSADTARPVQMWSEVLTLLSRDGNIGDALELRCPRHMEKHIRVRNAQDFSRLAPEGGCDELCGKRLEPCGHACPKRCHSEALHRAVVCPAECPRKLPGCDHACSVICGEKCRPCSEPIPQVLLVRCGHTSYNVPCHQAQDPGSIRCKHSVLKCVPGCGHLRDVACFLDVTSHNFKCPSPCGQLLQCGHQCATNCHQCRGSNSIDRHVVCKSLCGRPFNTCGHVCTKPCHVGKECGPCVKRCQLRCSHFQCTQTCSEICSILCVKECGWGCKHTGRCIMPCLVPCDILPCPRRCAQVLKCGHQCPSLCGEKCPPEQYCQRCASATHLERVVDVACGKTYKDIDLDTSPVMFPSCGHFCCMESIDVYMQMRNVYEYNEAGSIVSVRPQHEWINEIKPSQIRCPECQKPMTDLNRYNRVIKSVILEAYKTRTRQFISEYHQVYMGLEEDVTQMEKGMDQDMKTIEQDINSTVVGMVPTGRYDTLEELRARVTQFITSITQQEKLYTQIALVTEPIRRQLEAVTTSIDSESTSIGVNLLTSIVPPNLNRFRLPGETLRLRLEWAYLSDMHHLLKYDDSPDGANARSLAEGLELTKKISQPLSKLQADCTRLERDSRGAHESTRQRVHAKLLHARFVSLELQIVLSTQSQVPALPGHTFRLAPGSHYLTKTMEIEQRSLSEALALCDKYPQSTHGLGPLVEEAQRMHILRPDK